MDLDYNLLKSLSEEHGDSFYLLDSNTFEKNYSELITSFRKLYPKTFIGYSYKTNYIPRLCSIINKNKGFAEVVSEMEYDLAVKVGVDPVNIIVNGPYKTKATLTKFLIQGSLVNIDSLYEVQLVKEISEEFPEKEFRIGVRCNFQINSSYISRFGIDIDNPGFYDTFHILNGIPNVSLEGIHCHFPDRQLDLYKIRVQTMLRLSAEVFDTPPKFIDIGGGYFGKMPLTLANQFSVKMASYEDYANLIAGEFAFFFRETPDEKKPKLIIEPGSAIVADTMSFVAKAIEIKKVKNKQIVTTSGSKFNLGSFSSPINLPLEVYSSNNDLRQQKDTFEIAGYTCIENDYLYKDYFGTIKKGDFLVFSNVGSYSIVFKPPFILPNCAIIELGKNNEINIVRRKETFDDVFITYTL